MKKKHKAGEVQRGWMGGGTFPHKEPKGPCNIRKKLVPTGPGMYRQRLVDHSKYKTRPPGKK